jgi:hypothetical protein
MPNNTGVPEIAELIHYIRGHRVMLDEDLARIYGVETRIVTRAVRRNLDRFPEDFMFQLKDQEVTNLRSQIGISSEKHGGRRYLPYAFTEQGVAMLSSVLSSSRAVHANIEIMRAFVQFRNILSSHQELSLRLDQLELRYDKQFKIVFDVIREIMQPEKGAPLQIGFGRREDK